MLAPDAAIIDEPAIFKTLEQATPDAVAVREVLAKARQLNGLEAAEVAVLMNVSDPELLGELFAAARDVKDTIYGVTHGHGEIRRVNVNVAPLTDDEFRALSERSIGTYQLFQETDHHQTYASVHLGGKKRDYEWRVTAMDRAIESGINDVGIGVLFGLYDWRFELLALLQHIRRERFALGVSQISAGSRTNPGGYADDERADASQFCLGDHRDLDEVVRDVASLGYIPSFCTGCYRLGRTGQDFMDPAKPGEIKRHCDPNGLSTFLEYLVDHASPETRAVGEPTIADALAGMDDWPRERAVQRMSQVWPGMPTITPLPIS